jgi:hypothetical protein
MIVSSRGAPAAGIRGLSTRKVPSGPSVSQALPRFSTKLLDPAGPPLM